jgi:hypothetical protein
MRIFEKTVFMLIFLLFIPFAHALNCVDHDDGLKYYEASNVTFYGQDYPDRCVDSKILIEGYCNEDNLVLTSYDCFPSSCENEKCTQITTTSTTTTTTTTPPEERSGTIGTTTTTTSTTTSTTTTTTPPTEGISLSCEGSPSHSCSEKKDSYPGFPDIEEMDFSIPDSANCEDTIGVTVKWTGWHGYRDDNINECTPNYWAVFIETSPGIYSLLDSCQSFNESDCELFDPNTYIMNFDVKMPNKDSVVDGTYNILVTGETDSGYCNPDESNVDIELSKPINLMNCGESSSATTTSIVTTTPGEGGGLGTTTTTNATTQTTTTPEEITTSPSETTTAQSESTTTIKSGTSGGGGGGHILMQDLTKIIPIAVVIALVVLAIIFGIMKFTKSKNVEPKPQYNEESSEKPFY